jgi:hypothetical protein
MIVKTDQKHTGKAPFRDEVQHRLMRTGSAMPSGEDSDETGAIA